MKYIKKIAFTLCTAAVLLSLSACSGLEITEDMQRGIDAYTAAVEKSENKQSGKITVTSVADDAAIEFKKTESVIECEYSVEDGCVVYTRTDSLDGEVSAEYKCDGKTVSVRNGESEEWTDKTEENAKFISPETNPLTTLSLFRVDGKGKVKTEYMTDIEYNPTPDENGFTSVKFTLKDSTVSDILDYSKAKGIVRRSAGHTRTYYIDSEGYIARIEVSTVQRVLTNGQEGYYTTEMTVVCR